MTINSTTRKAGPFTGTGTVSAFPFGFKVFQASDLLVVRLNVSASVEQALVLNANYSVTLNPDQNSNPGGIVTLTAPLAVGYTLTLTSDVPDTQPTDLTNQGGFYPEVINDALDRATIQIQQLQEETDRTITAPISTPAGTDLTFPLPDANKFIGWNSTATGLQNLDGSTLASIVAFATAYADTFNGDGVTSTFALSYPPGTVRNLDVSINGVTQVPVVDYDIVGQALNLTTPPPLGSVLLAKYWQALPNSSGAAQDFTLTPNGYTTAIDVQEGFDDLGSSAGTSKVGFIQAGTGAQARPAQAKLRETVSVKDFGAVGDDVADDTAAIQDALDYAATVDGCTVYFPDGIYLISDPLLVYSNTTVMMSGTVKVDTMPIGGYETVFITDPVSPADNIQFINPQIDANNVVPTSGIMVRYGATNVRVQGGYIRNCANSSLIPGGRAFNIEGGTGTQNITISGTNITGCWNGVSLAGGAAQANSNVSITNLTISDCQVAVSLFGNTSGYPHTGEFMQAVFSNIAIRNCGHLTTFTTQAGVIVSDRGSNVSFSDIYVFNDAAYGAVGSLWRGDANNISMNNVTMDGDLTSALFDFSSYAESNSYPLAANSSLNSRFMNVKHNGTIPDIIALPIIGASYLTNCQFDVITDDVTSGAPGTANTANKTTCRLKAYNKTENAFIEGFLSDIGSLTFAEATDTLYPADNFAARAWGLFDGTTGTMSRSFNATSVRNSAGDYTVSFGNTSPVVSYVVVASVAAATGSDQVLSIQNKTQNDFDIFTFSGGVATDMPSINFVVYF